MGTCTRNVDEKEKYGVYFTSVRKVFNSMKPPKVVRNMMSRTIDSSINCKAKVLAEQ
jgi:hypothetical protein